MRAASALSLALLCLSWNAQAATVSQCVDAQGRTSFSFNGCPNAPATTLEVENQPPGGKDVVPMAAPRPREGIRERRAPVVVGERDDGCGNLLSARERREAIIHREVRAGMSRADVESAFGKPQRTSGRNGQLHYHYENGRERRRDVSFDEHGCVKQR